MAEPSPSTTPFVRWNEDRLDSWKEIAGYLNRDVTTVQRWEKREGMPVHRHLHDKKGSVYASRAELDAWVGGRKLSAAQENGTDAIADTASALRPDLASRSRWKLVLALAGVSILALVAILWLRSTQYFWRNPISDARLQTVTDFDGVKQAAAVSRDGHLIAFLSDRDGQMDVWLTQVGSGQFHNLTRGSISGLVNPELRDLGFSPDGDLVTFWARKPNGSNMDISVWAVPTLGGQPKLYLEGVAEFDWAPDGSRLVYHTPNPGDPMFVSNGGPQSGVRSIFAARAGFHSHFPIWAPNSSFIYFVHGELPDKLDIWRISPAGGTPERITSQNGNVTYPVLLDQRTLVYLATDPDGSGPRIYSMDVERRFPHRLSSGFDRYTSLAASADGRRLVATLATPKRSLWRLSINPSKTTESAATQMSLTTSTGFSPRLGPNFLLYVSATGANESIWKLANGSASELWSGPGMRFIAAPAISRDGHIAFSVRQHDRSLLYVMEAEGTNARVIADSLDLQGDLAWAPDGQSVVVAAKVGGVPHLFRVPIDGRAPTPIVHEYSVGPAWAPDGSVVLYSGPDIGTTFSVKAVTPEGKSYPLPEMTLTRGARRMVFLPEGQLVLLKGEIEHKNLWLINLQNGAERQLTNLPQDFDIRDFDVSADGTEVVLERVQQRSDIVMLDLPKL